MSTSDILQAKDPDLRNSFAAIQRAAILARQIAIQTNTDIVIMQDEKLVHLSAEQLRSLNIHND